MHNNPVMEALIAAFQLEITNHFSLTDDALLLTLPNQSHLKIEVIQVNPNSTHTMSISADIPRNHHTFHYFTAENRPLQKLTLHNIAECRAYLDDACLTFLNARLHNGEIQFPDSTAYLIIIEPTK